MSQLVARARQIKATLGTRAAAGYLRRREVPLRGALQILVYHNLARHQLCPDGLEIGSLPR